jgi:hypothetical protein
MFALESCGWSGHVCIPQCRGEMAAGPAAIFPRWSARVIIRLRAAAPDDIFVRWTDVRSIQQHGPQRFYAGLRQRCHKLIGGESHCHKCRRRMAYESSSDRHPPRMRLLMARRCCILGFDFANGNVNDMYWKPPTESFVP